ncbi:MAG: FAD-dependent oxidoreductase [Clostridium sp.]|uniref:FAD-dependent oxidoreductase n=1 Tax=Clostridium culturomicium TaxID=1499683 RepID=UPI00058B7B79|nr:FAD-dependent oxidoreductase [Clostridium culturomicium]MDU4891515.1 FAD-dependent oxidoreductase [Clostridium sp.]MDU7085846.1 FAD-dependent oxidoreductase [Clostridium sp.]
MKVVVIGCTHAGTAFIVNAKKKYPDCDIVVYEKNNNVSFLSCGIALSVSKVVTEPEKLFYNSPQNLTGMGIDMRMNHEVIDVDVDNKMLKAKNLKTGEVFEDKYDKLVLTLGSWPIVPKFEGGELDNILLCKNYDHAKMVIEKSKDAKNIAVIGAGYIGVELAEAFEMQGKNTILIDAEDRIMNKYLDKEFTDVAENEFIQKGVKLKLGQKVQKFEGLNGKVTKIVTDKETIEADLVILCIGFAPNTGLVRDKVKTLKNGAIIIDQYMRTSAEDIFAAGDCCMVKYNPAYDERYIPLATNAVRMGTLIAENLVEPRLRYLGTQGTSGIKIYDQCIASTGMTEEVAKSTTAMKIGTALIKENHRPEFMPTYSEAMLKIVFDKVTHRVIGGQIVSKQDLTQFMNTLSVIIQNHMTLEELAVTDFFFQPHFNKPWSILNSVALKALEK